MAKRKIVLVPGDGTYGNGTIDETVPNHWRVRWREGSRRMAFAKGLNSRAEAADKLAEIQANLRNGRPGVAPKPANVSPVVTVAPGQSDTFADHLEDFIAYRVARKRRMAAEDRSRWKRYLAPALEAHTIAGLTSAAIADIAQELVNPSAGSKWPDGAAREAVSGPTATRALALLSSFYRWAQRAPQNLASGNPVRSVLSDPDIKSMLASTHDKAKRRTLKSWDDVDRLYAAMARTSVGLAFYLCARAGLRPGEAYALRWGSVDLDAKAISVSRQVRNGKEGPTKSGKPRSVPLSPKLAAELEDWRDLVPHDDADLVCPPPAKTTNGTYLGKRSISATLKAAFVATGIKRAELYAVGRHTFGTLVGTSAMVSAPRLQAIMGHANIETTLRYIQADGPLTATELKAFG
jgi:integrase